MCRMSSSFMMPKSCNTWIAGAIAALHLADDILVLEIIQHTLALDERQQRI